MDHISKGLRRGTKLRSLMCRGAVPDDSASNPKGICMYLYVYMREKEREKERESESCIEGQDLGFRLRL